MLVLLTDDTPCCYELTPVNKRLARKYEKETGHESVLIQTDWDYPSLAESLGWNMRKAHKRNCPDPGSTDGTVTCKGCGRGAGHFIESAREWLEKHLHCVMRADVDAYFGF